MISRPVIYFCISTAAGCLCALLLKYNIVLDAAVTASFLICIFMAEEKHYICLCICFFIIGFLNFEFYFNIGLNPDNAYKIRVITKNNYYSVGEYKGRKINLEGKISGIKEGEIITAIGQYKPETDFESGSIGSFKVTEIEDNKEDLITKIYDFKSSLYKKFYWQIGENNAAKVMAIAFGDTSHLSYDDKEDFKKLGIVHAVSVSGMHMAVLFKCLQIFLSLEAAFAVCTFYAVFTGFQAATVRSLLMLIIYKYSKKLNKNYDFLSAISLAALILLIFKPYYIVDIGFMLSFLSTLGMSVFSRKLSKVFFKFPKIINEALSVSISAQIFSMPYALFTIKNFSFGFILGNLFIVPIFSAVVILGNFALAVLPVKFLFNAAAFLISIFLTVANVCTELLLKITPPLVFMSAFNSMIIFTLYICYIFIKRGYKKAAYIPFVMLIFVFAQYYSFFPTVSYVKLEHGCGYTIRNKFNAALISSYNIEEKEKAEIEQKLNVNSINSCENNNVTISLDNKYIIYISEKGENVKINKINNDEFMLVMNNKAVKYQAVNSNKIYDIIKIEDLKKLKKRDLPEQCLDFNIIMDKIIAVKE